MNNGAFGLVLFVIGGCVDGLSEQLWMYLNLRVAVY